MKFKILAFIWLSVLSGTLQAFNSFQIEDVKIEGLQRIALGTVLTYLPLKVGEMMDAGKSEATIQALFNTGFFNDVILYRKDNVLIIKLNERPSISSIKIFGNEEIKTEDLTEALKKIGLAEGRVFNRSLLDQVEQELHRQYFNLGNYGVEIDTKIEQLERNRVDVQLDIKEGDAAKIKGINLIGATAYKKSSLLSNFQLSEPTMISFISGSDKYSKQKLLGDLEVLRSFYLDRGYINFDIASTQVNISPDKKDVFIAISLAEGEQFRVKDISLAGNLIVDEAELRSLIRLKTGDIFSRRQLVESTNRLTDRLAVDGYAFANVNAVPNIDKENRLISLKFLVEPGNRVYVRRINISGNTKTKDSVIRRELRQMEGGWLSTPLLNRSKVRLQRLGFFDNVTLTTPKVPGTVDQVDVNIEVVEGSTGSFSAGVGYGQLGGFLFNASVTVNNYLGTGKRVSFEINNSQINKIYSFNFNNPYYTPDGVSRNFSIFLRSTNAGAANLAAFNTDVIGAKLGFGIPVSEYTTLRTGLGYEDTFLRINRDSAPETYKDWIIEYTGDPRANQAAFKTWTISSSFGFDTRNRAMFPDSGLLSRVSAELALPGGDLEYYKVNYKQKWYIPIITDMSLLFAGEYAYGNGYGDTLGLPFFENYYAGGTRSVRGYKGNTIGPKDEVCFRDDPFNCSGALPVGGNNKLVGSMELFFPIPFMEETSQNFKLSAFVDAGRVWLSGESGEPAITPSNEDWRMTYGIAAIWVTPMGAFVFNLAWPIDHFYVKGDQTETFSFNIGAPF